MENAEKPVVFKVLEKDSEIVLSDDFAASALIREPDFKLIRIRQSHPEFETAENINDPEFYKKLRDLTYNNLDTSSQPEGDEKRILDAIVTYDKQLKARFEEMGFSEPFLQGIVASTNEVNQTKSVRLWHQDGRAVTAVVGLWGNAMDFVVGELSDEEREALEEDQVLPPHVTVDHAEPGDVMIMKGRTDYFKESVKGAFHRSGSGEKPRAALVYCLGEIPVHRPF